MKRHRILFAAACALAFPTMLAALPRGPLRCEGGLAGPYPCHAVDQASFVPLNDLSPADRWVDTVLGWRHEESGRELALVPMGTRTSIVEVTDPESPRLIGHYGGEGERLGAMAVFGDHLYAVNGLKLDIFDLTRLLSAAPPAHFPPDASVDLPIGGGITINPDTGFAYVFSAQIVALDLNHDPEDPEQVMIWSQGTPYPRNLECVLYHGPDSRFLGHEICTGAARRHSLVVYDVTDKAHPVKLSRAFYRRFNSAWHTAITPNHRFLLLADAYDEHNPGFNTRTFLFDLTSLTAPVEFASYDGPTKGRDLHLEVRGRYAFLANATAGVRVLDLRQIDKGRVREVGFFDVEPGLSNANWFGAHSVDVLPSGTVIVGSARQGLYVLVPRLQP